MKRITLIISLIILTFSSAVSCLDTTDMETRLDKLDERIAALEEAVGKINDKISVEKTVAGFTEVFPCFHFCLKFVIFVFI